MITYVSYVLMSKNLFLCLKSTSVWNQQALNDMSRPFTECVRAPTLTKSTPCSA